MLHGMLRIKRTACSVSWAGSGHPSLWDSASGAAFAPRKPGPSPRPPRRGAAGRKPRPPALGPTRMRRGAFAAGRTLARRRAGGSPLRRRSIGSATRPRVRPTRRRLGSPGRNDPHRAGKSPPAAESVMGRALSGCFGPPGRSGPEPAAWRDEGSGGPPSRRRRRIGSATRPRVRPKAAAAREALAEMTPTEREKARRSRNR